MVEEMVLATGARVVVGSAATAVRVVSTDVTCGTRHEIDPSPSRYYESRPIQICLAVVYKQKSR